MIGIVRPDFATKLDANATRIFLAGPVQGAPDDWHLQIVNCISAYFDNVTFFIPASLSKWKNSDKHVYSNQINWETSHLDSADIIFFYLPNKVVDIEGREYAQTSRYELGERLAKARENNQKVFVLAEEGFSGTRYFKFKIENEYSDIAYFQQIEKPKNRTNDLPILGKDIFEKVAKAIYK